MAPLCSAPCVPQLTLMLEQFFMKEFTRKFKIPLILLSCGLTLFGLPLKQPIGFLFFSLPGILLGLLIFLTTKSTSTPLALKSKEKGNSADELLKWLQLKEKGVISEEEFQNKKNEILGS